MQSLREWLTETPFTLTMSSGFFSFFAHCGIISVLEDEGIEPAKITGSSAGGLIGICWSCGCSARELQQFLFQLNREDFWDPAPGWGFLRGARFRKIVDEMCDHRRLEDGRIPVTVSVMDVFKRSVATLQTGGAANAAYATCAVPLMFQPLKDNGRYYLDGGIVDRAGLAGTGDGERVFYHHISSRSPWRRKHSAALEIPERHNMRSFTIESLPRVGPYRLSEGKTAFQKAQTDFSRALKMPIGEAVISLP